MEKKTYNDVVDLSDVTLSLWENKFKILIITTLSLVLGYSYFFSSNEVFLAKTNIKPISTFESQKYKIYNILANEILREQVLTDEKLLTEESFNLDKEFLLDLFISQIKTEKIIEDGIIKFKLINKGDFKNEQNYKKAIKKKAIEIIDSLTYSSYEKNNNLNINNNYWKYNFEISDKVVWTKFLEDLQKKANEKIRLFLLDQFNKEIEIVNTGLKFKLENIEQNITNAVEDYKISISYRLEFLKEQAEIARELKIAKNTLEASNFPSDNTIITNIKSENPYYLKGYEMIEKEISLINNRKNERAFIPALTKLENSKRAILQNKIIDRLKFLFAETPVNNKDDFIAAKIDYVTTTYEPKKSLSKILSISLIIGLLISFMYISFYKILKKKNRIF